MASNPDTDPGNPGDGRQRLVLVTGPSGAGRSTAINTLEDRGYEVIDNLPLSLLDRLLDGPPLDRPIALGIDVRNRDFTVDAFIGSLDRLLHENRLMVQVLYLDCDETVLLRRYSETRRRHPMAPEGDPLTGIQRELSLLGPIRARADLLIDSTGLTPHDLRAEIEDLLCPDGGRTLSVSVQSFSYKRGLPRGADLVLDCRFLRNPHWEAGLRPLDGRAPEVAAHIEADPLYADFLDRVLSLARLLLPAYHAEGKSHLTLAFGCTGGQHRSVAMAETLANILAAEGWQVSKRHRELERRADLVRTTREAGE
ncbi:RNase adapter RapZ [Loktanella sp. IMCC34160]|uniref:RNase adapter RapZ n=1 Tax=Loktanella sp. IMCC34160 TaxID=2510646 RepID=UPI00101CEFB3|nr:RNase adapter RapZ [Loktanella sp. IMCC34160]RYG91603.1 RNase adapter RapZ [Loktanella sp. IMCC34160]